MASETELVELMKEQNRLLLEQNDLLRRARAPEETTEAAPPGTAGRGRMMTEYDLMLIVNSDNVMLAITRWNKRGK